MPYHWILDHWINDWIKPEKIRVYQRIQDLPTLLSLLRMMGPWPFMPGYSGARHAIEHKLELGTTCIHTCDYRLKQLSRSPGKLAVTQQPWKLSSSGEAPHEHQ
jgi:hypothetical protein